MKACVCDGSNENCMYCGGSGYVDDDKALPRRPDDLGSWLPNEAPERPREGWKVFVGEGRTRSFSAENIKRFLAAAGIWLVMMLLVVLIAFVVAFLREC